MTLPAQLRIVIADDQAMIRFGLRMICEDADDMVVVGEAGDGVAAVQQVLRTRPDVVLMDVRMPVLDGIGAIAQIMRDTTITPPACLVLTTFDDEDYLAGALGAGAAGFLLKDAEPDALLAAIRNVASGDAVLDPAVTARVVRGYVAGRTIRDPRIDLLSSRELEVLGVVAEGLSNVEVGQRLFCSEATVKSHIRSMLTKLNLTNRVQLVIFAYESRLISP